ncbi:MAG: YheU family protein [Gammaproteobacteria bacterium]|nr:YheU family protein [Gammaproteobacteria bacterium]MBT8151355.1 YheU family protein [Gammaproteobacteria bacterium]NND39041.1 YheU family protein [Pseudomonadales bacterium]NNM12016.1 YheU family protein [Pseudomonadales bacterium]RZV49759.1 MAG: YheU family protein [Pseudomonadales bacterium]
MSDDPDPSANWLKVPKDALSEHALQGVLEDFASRDGTDYGAQEVELEQKVAQLRNELDAGTCVIVFDRLTNSCQIVSRKDIAVYSTKDDNDAP